MTERRVRRPRDKDPLLEQITGNNPFQTMRDALGFAGALGFAIKRRVPYQQSGEQIRWEDFTNRRSNELLVNMIAVSTVGDFSILSAERFQERLAIFEEYANGGLEVIQEWIGNSSRSTLDSIIDELFGFEVGDIAPGDQLDLETIAKGLAW